MLKIIKTTLHEKIPEKGKSYMCERQMIPTTWMSELTYLNIREQKLTEFFTIKRIVLES